MLLLQQSEATAAQRRVPVYLVDDTDGKTPETGITFSAGDIKISKNGGAEANHAGTVTELAGGLYYYEATAGELDTLGVWTARFIKAGVRTFVAAQQVVPWDPYDTVRLGQTALPNAAAEAAGGLYTRGSGAGQINQNANGQVDSRTVAMAADVVSAAAVANGAIDAATFAAGAIDAAAIANGAIDAATFAAGAIDAAAIANNAIDAATFAADTALTLLGSLVSGTSDSGTTTTMVDAARSEADTDYWKGLVLVPTSGNILGQARLITAFTPGTDTITFTPATTQAWATQTYTIRPMCAADVRLWLGTAPNVLVSGRVDSSVGAMAADVMTAAAAAADLTTELQTGLATAAALATVQADTDNIQTRLPAALVSGRMDASVGAMAADVMTAAAAAADLTTELQTGLATAAALATVQADTDDIQTRLPAALVSGRMDSSVGAMASGVLTATAIAADAITAAKVAADVTTELQAGLATAAALTTAQADLDDIQTRLPAALVSGRMDSSVGAMAAGVVTATAVATDAIDADALAADAVTEIAAAISVPSAATIADAVWDEVASGHATPGTFGAGDHGGYPAVAHGTVVSGSNTATSFATDLASAVSNYYKDALLLVVDGALAGQVKKVTTYNGGTNVITLTSALTSTPADGVAFLLVNR